MSTRASHQPAAAGGSPDEDAVSRDVLNGMGSRGVWLLSLSAGDDVSSLAVVCDRRPLGIPSTVQFGDHRQPFANSPGLKLCLCTNTAAAKAVEC